jgi:hypothetical protein
MIPARGRFSLLVDGGMSLASGIGASLAPSWAPMAILVLLLAGVRTWRAAWIVARGTTLRGALAWAAVAIGLGLLAQAVALSEPLESGRPWTARVTYVMVLAILAGLISVLGARSPGGGAWAILMVLLVVVFLIPWLEGSGRLRRAQGLSQLQLDSPWTLFYGLLVLAGVTNYLPTRYGPAAACLGLGLVLEYLGLTRPDWTAPARAATWTGVAWSAGASLLLAGWCASLPVHGRNALERHWFGFRDHWGVVWGLRTLERFNRTAELARWPFRLTWFGLAPADPSSHELPDELPAAAESTFVSLTRRFATAAGLLALAGGDGGRACHPDRPGG